MILEYHRPEQLDQALQLLGREEPANHSAGWWYPDRQFSCGGYRRGGSTGARIGLFPCGGQLRVIGAMQRMQALADEREIHPALQQLIARDIFKQPAPDG